MLGTNMFPKNIVKLTHTYTHPHTDLILIT